MVKRGRGRRTAGACLLALLLAGTAGLGQQQTSGDEHATASASAGHYELHNRAVAAGFVTKGEHIDELLITDRLHNALIPIPQPFAILMKDGTIYRAENVAIAGQVAQEELAPRPAASRMSDRIHGQQIDVPLETPDHALHLTWSLVLRDGSQYIRQSLTIAAADHAAAISRVQLIDLALAHAQVAGSVEGSPIVADNLFAGFEHPISHSKVTAGRATAWIDRDLPLKAGQSVTYSAVIGVAREGQMRRDFLAYVERERAHPYRTFLHYNSWFDLGFGNDFDAQGAVDRVNAFGRELKEKRGVTLDSYLFDDGWDGHHSLWKFNAGFPDGFTPVKQAAEKYGAEPGVWMSPWGGYGKAKQERIEFGKSQGYEIVAGGYALSGPKYYAAFRDVALDMMRTYGVNQFKFDGTGNVDSVFPGSQFDSDFSAAIHLIDELRAAKPDVFINLTTGTWPSPFWLRYADSTWRGGDDDNATGVGPYRERWITYRDAETYQNIVQGGPLYPLNSLMLHGIIYAKQHPHLNKDLDNRFRNEVRSYFGTGTQLQEMYITPELLTDQNWDDLAEAAKWARDRQEVLKDTHWVGGNPAWLEVYGWAAWTPARATLVLRNPSDKPQSIKLKLADVFELPAGAAQNYTAKSPWKSDAARPAMDLNARAEHEYRLEPFEVLTLDMTAR
ncbi:alpha-galactosidase [Occallatibacter riparius]|uniref:Enterotoxin n=1 Tax=Occallatibacter riparius TaxID=1002689 RepID=A0A9J7BP31_9BACT|nr:enterotoxin [Occallatibacter riparius]UWZ84491.1 enterotoxin [Occallatibacter riparius]